MSLDHLFNMEEKEKKILFEKAVNFGKSLQLINILRDLPEDLRMGRCYIPSQTLHEIEMTSEDLLEMNNIEKFRPLYDSYILRAENYLDDAVDYIKMLPRSQFIKTGPSPVRCSKVFEIAPPVPKGSSSTEIITSKGRLDDEKKLCISSTL